MSDSSYTTTASSNYSIFGGGRTNRPARLEGGVTCDCGLVAPCWEAWRRGTADPGRRFFGCSRFRDPQLKCKIFQWADSPYTERARQVVEDLLEKLTIRLDEIVILREDIVRKDKELNVKEVQLGDMKEEMKVQESRLSDLKNDVKVKDMYLSEIKKDMQQLKKAVKMVVVVLLASWLFFICKWFM